MDPSNLLSAETERFFPPMTKDDPDLILFEESDLSLDH